MMTTDIYSLHSTGTSITQKQSMYVELFLL